MDGLVYTNSQPYSKRACAFGLRSLSKLLTLSALVKLEKNLFILERITTKMRKNAQKGQKNDQKVLFWVIRIWVDGLGDWGVFSVSLPQACRDSDSGRQT